VEFISSPFPNLMLSFVSAPFPVARTGPLNDTILILTLLSLDLVEELQISQPHCPNRSFIMVPPMLNITSTALLLIAYISFAPDNEHAQGVNLLAISHFKAARNNPCGAQFLASALVSESSVRSLACPN
jgi:hypothetical protein